MSGYNDEEPTLYHPHRLNGVRGTDYLNRLDYDELIKSFSGNTGGNR